MGPGPLMPMAGSRAKGQCAIEKNGVRAEIDLGRQKRPSAWQDR